MVQAQLWTINWYGGGGGYFLFVAHVSLSICLQLHEDVTSRQHEQVWYFFARMFPLKDMVVSRYPLTSCQETLFDIHRSDCQSQKTVYHALPTFECCTEWEKERERERTSSTEADSRWFKNILSIPRKVWCFFFPAGMSKCNCHNSFSLVATSNGRYSPRPFSALAVRHL